MKTSDEWLQTPSEMSDLTIEDRFASIAFFSGELPHESKDEVFRLLHLRSKTRQYPLLASFIDLSLAGIREELKRLPQYLRELFPPFENIIDIARCEQDLEKGLLCGAIQRIVLCLLKLGLTIAYHEQHPETYTWSAANSCSLGMGVGMLMCGALSLSPRLTDLPAAAAETVRLSFRFGILVGDFSRSIEPVIVGDAPKRYVCSIMDVDEQTVQKQLDQIQDAENTPRTSRVMVCNVRNCSTSVDGPPEKVAALFRDHAFFRESKHIPMTAYGGICHAPDVYSAHDASKIVGTISLKAVPSSPVLSLSTGEHYQGSNATELFERISYDVLKKPVRWEENLAGAITQMQNCEASTCTIFEASASHPMKDLSARLTESIPGIEVRTVDLISWIKTTPISDDRPRSTAQSKLAIVGMSCRFPGGANGNEEFWDLLMDGMDVHRTVPADRFNVSTHCDPSGKKLNATKTPYGCFIDDPALFDPHFFGMSPTEAKQTDPMHRLALVTAYEALEMAGHVNGQSIDASRVGTFYGQASDDYREVNSGQEVSTYFINGGCRAFAPGKINYFFKFSGPSYSIDTACSSALATIQEACDSLWAGNTDMVVAGGLNVLTNCDVYAGLSHGHFLSPTGGCKTWDTQADGYCRADGVGSVVIKRLEDAQDNNDNILGVVLSAATNHSANAISITHPHAPTQEALYRQVVSRSGIDPLSVGYVEMHGTGTKAGDLNETTSITNVFAPVVKPRKADQPLYMGTVKSNMGHGEAAAGSMALHKALLVFRNGVIPPHIGIKNELSPDFPKQLDRRNLHIPFKAVEWARNPDKPRIAVVNNFGAAGGNTTLILQEGPVSVKDGRIPVTRFPFVLSAKGKVKDSPSLRALTERLIEFINSNPDTSLADLSYTLCARRMHHSHRLALTASTLDELRQKLAACLDPGTEPIVVSKAPLPIAFVFTGQGSFYNGIATELYHEHDFYRKIVLHLDYLCVNNGFPSILPIFEGTASEEQQASAVIQQLAILTTELALIRFWEYLGVKPNVVIGHSLGEYAALCAAGVLTASEAIFLVGSRARMLEQSCRAGAYVMLAVRASVSDISTAAEGFSYEVACINGPKETVVAGPADHISALSEHLSTMGIKATALDIPYAFHSAQMDAVLESVRRTCSGLVFRKPLIPVVSPLLGTVVTEPGTFNTDYVLRATREAVDFVGALRAAEEAGVFGDNTVFLELGPHPICLPFIRKTLQSVKHTIPSIRRKEDCWTTLATSLTSLHLAGVPIHWRELYQPFEKDSLTLLDLPRYPWNNQRYWIQYQGDWCLTKGLRQAISTQVVPESRMSSTIQNIIEEQFDGTSGKVVAQSNVLESQLLAAIEGHKMNDVGVLSSFLHADAAYTIAKYMYERGRPDSSPPDMDLTDFDYHGPVVAQRYSKDPQLWKIVAKGDVADGLITVNFYHPEDKKGESNAHAVVRFGKAASWLSEWSPLSHLISSRIDQLRGMAESGNAIQVNKLMAYRLFAKLVDYSKEYWNMDSVILNDLEAVADITLPKEPHGAWTCSPFDLDAFASLPGFILNGVGAVDNDRYFYLTPAWQSMRLAKPLQPNGKYQSYVRMVQDRNQPRVYRGDVYILHEGEIIGLVRQIEFWAWQRNQLSVFFKLPDAHLGPSTSMTRRLAPHSQTKEPKSGVPYTSTSTITPPLTPPSSSHGEQLKDPEALDLQAARQDSVIAIKDEAGQSNNAVVTRALQIIAEQTELKVSDLVDDAQLADLGIDSMMSLELAGRFRGELEIEVRDAMFAEFPSMGDLKKYLSQNFGA